MLNGIDKLLTGDMLKHISDMGHGDELVIADANFPAETLAKRLVRLPGIDGVTVLKAILPLFPVDTYVDEPALLMELTDSDRAAGMSEPAIWGEYRAALSDGCKVGFLERHAFYERAAKAYLVIQTGEERIYGNLLLGKGCVL